MKLQQLCIGVKTAVQQYVIGNVFLANAQSTELHKVHEIVHQCEVRILAIYDCKSVYSQCTIYRTL
jgi:hypothetical protein